jgi:hypothetical protein
MLETLVVGVDIAVITHQVVPLLTPKFGKESDLWVQLGEESVRWREGFFR